MDQNGQRANDNTLPEPNLPNIQESQIMNDNEASNESYINESDRRPTDILLDRGRPFAPNAFRLLFKNQLDEKCDELSRARRMRDVYQAVEEIIQFVHDNGGRFLRRVRRPPSIASSFEELIGDNLMSRVDVNLRYGSRRRRNIANPQEPGY